jgi:hypothetical protein
MSVHSRPKVWQIWRCTADLQVPQEYPISDIVELKVAARRAASRRGGRGSPVVRPDLLVDLHARRPHRCLSSGELGAQFIQLHYKSSTSFERGLCFPFGPYICNIPGVVLYHDQQFPT